MRQRLVGGILGAISGFGFTTMGLIDTSNGFELRLSGGNDATGTIIIVGLVLGLLLGATILAPRPFVIVGLIAGLALGLWLRDNAGTPTVQPPWVFVLLFGLPLAGAVVGYLFSRGPGASTTEGER